jgi:hypothetical protein
VRPVMKVHFPCPFAGRGLRRDALAGMSGRAIEKKYPVERRSIIKALSSAWAGAFQAAAAQGLQAGRVQAGDR